MYRIIKMIKAPVHHSALDAKSIESGDLGTSGNTAHFLAPFSSFVQNLNNINFNQEITPK